MSTKSSTIITEKRMAQTHHTTVAIEQTWTIDSFSFYVDAEDKVTWLNSTPFSLGFGYPNFRLTMRPTGDGKEYKDYVSLYLECTAEPSVELPINYQFSIIDKDGQHKKTRGPIDHTFTNPYSWGYKQFIVRAYLLDPKNGLLVDDQLKIYCKINVSFNKSTSGLSNRLHDDFGKLSLNMAKLLDNGRHSDVILCIDGTDIPAHKNILSAASSVFERMFDHEDTKEAQEGKVIIEDVNVDTFKVLLKYLYSGQIPEMEQLTKELLVASDKYLVDDLKMACEEYLSTSLTIDSAAQLFLLADTHNASTLKVNCLRYITANAVKVMATEGWKVMHKAQSELVDQVCLHLAMKTEELWKQLYEEKEA